MTSPVRQPIRQCPICDVPTSARWCCGLDLADARPWRMTRSRIRAVHVLARSRKGLDEETYRARLAAIGVTSSLQFTREQFDSFMRGLRALPDALT
jgi:hypothetical protein